MATIPDSVLVPEDLALERLRPIRRVEYERMVEVGLLTEDDRVELLRGFLVTMSPQKAPHAGVIERLDRLFQSRLGDRASVRVQLPLALSDDSEPEPDLALVTPGDHDETHPRTALLVVEVADTTLRKDRRIKAALYAAAGIPEYWVVNLLDRVIEVHAEPGASGYATIASRSRGQSIRLVTVPDCEIAVADILRGA